MLTRYICSLYHLESPYSLAVHGSYTEAETGAKRNILVGGQEYLRRSGFWYIRLDLPANTELRYRLMIINKYTGVFHQTERAKERTLRSDDDLSYFLMFANNFQFVEKKPLHLADALPHLTNHYHEMRVAYRKFSRVTTPASVSTLSESDQSSPGPAGPAQCNSIPASPIRSEPTAATATASGANQSQSLPDVSANSNKSRSPFRRLRKNLSDSFRRASSSFIQLFH